jgi:ABC-type nitrate/sulfonate/bicarbonate transport system substrate-binding protein
MTYREPHAILLIALSIPSAARSSAAAACSLVVVSLALGFTPGDDAPPLQLAKLGCDHGEAGFDVAVVAK